MRFYTRRGGGLGVSFGLVGALVYAFGVVLSVIFLALLCVPFVILGIIALLGMAGDGVIRVVPAYRRRRVRLGPVRWYRSAFDACRPAFTTLWIRLTGRRPPRRSTGQTSRARPVTSRAVPQVPARADQIRELKRKEFIKFVNRLTPVEFCRLAEDILKKRGFGAVALVPGSDVITMVDSDRLKVAVKCLPYFSGASVGVQEIRQRDVPSHPIPSRSTAGYIGRAVYAPGAEACR